MTHPTRIQRKRTAGYKLPANTKCVTRGTRYGNPFAVGKEVPDEWFDVFTGIDRLTYFTRGRVVPDAAEAVRLFEQYVLPTLNVSELRGYNIACWCKIGEPCHGESILNKLVNE